MKHYPQEEKWVRRTRYLINRRFQFRYIGVLILSALFASLTIGGVLYAIVEVNWLLQLDRGLHFLPETRELLTWQRTLVGMVFLIIFVLMATLLSLWGLFLSHRVAGPVFSISRRLKSIFLECDFTTPLKLRKKDALQEVKDELNDALATLLARFESEIAFWNDINDRLTAAQQKFVSPQFKTILREVAILKKEKEKCLGF